MASCKSTEGCAVILSLAKTQCCLAFRLVHWDYSLKSPSVWKWAMLSNLKKCIQVNQNLWKISIYFVNLFQYESSHSTSTKSICFVQLAPVWIHVSAWLNCPQVFFKEISQFPLKILYSSQNNALNIVACWKLIFKAVLSCFFPNDLKNLKKN